MMDNEQALLRRYVQSRDAVAFRELVDEHKGMVFAACRRVLGNQADAEDAAQDCFLKLAQAAGRLKAPIAGWLHTVAVRSAIDVLRGETARKARERAVVPRKVEASESRWEDVEGEVDTAVESLPERLRVPIVLYFLEGQTQEDVAAALGVSRRSMARRLDRGIDALRRRLKRAGVVAPAVALAAMLSANTAEAAPAALTATLGKIALAVAAAAPGVGGAKVAAATGGTLAAVKTAVALVAAAGAGAGAVVVHQATVAQRPMPLAAAAPAAKKAPLTPKAALDAVVTLPSGEMTLSALAHLLKDQVGVYSASHARVALRALHLEPGKHTVRDVLAAVTASVSLTTEAVFDRDRVVICFWQKPDAQALAEMVKLAGSDDVVERCTAAHWLEAVGGRAALVQLLKMLSDPEARVSYFAARAVSIGWGSVRFLPASCIVESVVPEGTGVAVAKAIASAKWPGRRKFLLQVSRRLRDPKALPILKKQLETALGGNHSRNRLIIYQVLPAIAAAGGPEAEAILLAAVDELPVRYASEALKSLGVLGTDRAIARLSKQVDIAAGSKSRRRFRNVAKALGASDRPAAAHELLRILKMPGISSSDASDVVKSLLRFDTPEVQAACLARFKDSGLVRIRSGREMMKFPLVREYLFAELAQGGAVGRRAAILLGSTNDPRLVAALAEIIRMDADALRADRMDPVATKAKAIGALGRIGGAEAEKMLLGLLEGDGTLRSTVHSALGHINSPAARNIRKAALQDPHGIIRSFAAQALATRPDPADIELLVASAREELPAAEADMAARGIWNAVATIGGTNAVKELLAEIAAGSSIAAGALVSSDDPLFVKAVRDVLAGDDAASRELLMDGFDATVSGPASLSAFYAVNLALTELTGASAAVKERRVRLLGWTRAPRGTDALGKLLVDAGEPVNVRRAAVTGLSRATGSLDLASDPASVEPVRHAYENDTDGDVKKRAKEILQFWGVIAFDARPPLPPRKPRPPRKPKPEKNPKPQKPDPKDPPEPVKPPDEREFPQPPAP